MSNRFIMMGNLALIELQKAYLSRENSTKSLSYAMCIQYSIIGISDIIIYKADSLKQFYHLAVKIHTEGVLSDSYDKDELLFHTRLAKFIVFTHAPEVKLYAIENGVIDNVSDNETISLRKCAEYWLSEFVRLLSGISVHSDSSALIVSGGEVIKSIYKIAKSNDFYNYSFPKETNETRLKVISETIKTTKLFFEKTKTNNEIGVYIFGSLSRGDFFGDSDIDIAIVTPDSTERPIIDKKEASAILDRDVDIISITKNELISGVSSNGVGLHSVWKHIIRHGKHIYGHDYISDECDLKRYNI